ncbi:MAG: aminotransferase [Caulobacteraceae bacterium]
MNPLYTAIPTSIFSVMSQLAAEHDAVNLGQGFPDGPGPEDVRAHAAEALMSGSNQYAPSPGTPELRQAVAAHYKRFQGLDLGWKEQVVVTSGATEALAASFLALIAPGDEAVILEPAYDCYAPQIVRAGGVPVPVRLAPPDWAITREMLDAVATPRTRLVVVCNPHNPAARLYTPEELAVIAQWCVDRDVIAVSDEVWEHIVFDGRPFTSLMSLPGMAGRTVKIGSAGKIFSMTGWKIGWVCAPPHLAAAIMKAHQYLTFASAPHLQAAVAYGLAKEDAYFDVMRAGFQRSRDRLADGLRNAGWVVLPSQGSYFLNIDLAASGVNQNDEAFCMAAVKKARVAAIPVSAFYREDPVRTVARLCFAKNDATIDLAVERLTSG